MILDMPLILATMEHEVFGIFTGFYDYGQSRSTSHGSLPRERLSIAGILSTAMELGSLTFH